MTTDTIKVDRKKLLAILAMLKINYSQLGWQLSRAYSDDGFHVSTIVRWNRHGWPRDKFERLCAVLGVEPGAIMGSGE